MSDNERSVAEQRAAWRASIIEDVLWPEQPICDAHHHLWDHAGDRYFAAEFAADITDGHRVVKSVYIECGSAYRTLWNALKRTAEPYSQDERDLLFHDTAVAVYKL